MLAQSYFTHILPKARLGQCHSSKDSFLEAVFNEQKSSRENNAKEFTLVIVTECSTTSDRRILLGLKRRGFLVRGFTMASVAN